MSNLDSVNEKIVRANEHFQVFQEQKTRYLESTKRSMALEVDKQKRVAKLTFTVTPPPPLPLSIIIGDCVHNLRSALDNLVCALIRLKEPESRCGGTAFPIFIDLDKYRLKRDGILGKRIPQTVRRLFDDLQPAARLDGTANIHPLRILNRLSNDDKHRAPNLVASHSSRTHLEFVDRDGRVVHELWPPTLKSGTPIGFRDVPDVIETGMHVEVRGALNMAFYDIGPWGDRPVDEILIACIDYLEKFVIPRFVPLFH